MIYYAVEEN